MGDSPKIVQENELRLWQICPALPHFNRDSPGQLGEYQHRASLRDKMCLSSLRWLIYQAIKTNQIPSPKEARFHWASILARNPETRELTPHDFKELVTSVSGVVVKFSELMTERHYIPLLPRTPITLPAFGSILITYPEGLLSSKQEDVLLLEYQSEGMTAGRSWFNNIVTRARAVAVSSRLNRLVPILCFNNHGLFQIIQVHAIYDRALKNSICHAVASIAEGSWIPLTKSCMKEKCPFYERCWR